MLEYSFSVKHEGCWTADINDRFPDVSATILQSHAFSASSATITEFEDIDAATTEDVVAWMADHPVVRAVELLKHQGDTGLLSIQTDYSDSHTEPVGTVLRDRPCIPLSSPEVRNGFEHCHLMMATKEEVRETYEELRGYGPVEIRSLTELESDYGTSDLTEVSHAVADLSDRQRHVLSRAIEEGYYDVPQSCTAEDLAEMDDATMSTVAEHLRLAEHKVFDAMEPLLALDDDDV